MATFSGIEDDELEEMLFAPSSDSESEDDFDNLGYDNDVMSDNDEHPNDVPPDPTTLPTECTEKLENLRWVDYHSTNVRCCPFQFTGNPGIKVPINDFNDPLEIFKLFITNDLVDNIVRNTNLYAEQFLAFRPLKQFSRYRAWVPTDRDEIFVLLALYILVGMIWKPVFDKYYTKKPIFFNAWLS